MSDTPPNPDFDTPRPTVAPLLEAAGVTKQFSGVTVLHDGRLTVRLGTVHALCGGNGAGKSTFLSIVMGLLSRDGGTVTMKGSSVNFTSPAQALDAGISIITQELSPILGLTVAENIYLGREPMIAGVWINYPALFARAKSLLERLGFDIDPRSLMCNISLAKVQLVEIAKAISFDSSVLIMDEPTSAIGEHETEVLFNAIRGLKKQGVGIIYVSHRLSELFQIADEYTVFRDGRFVETGEMAGITRERLIELIVGRKVGRTSRPPQDTATPVILKADDYSQTPHFQNVSLALREGEILGIYGLMGAGRSEFLNCLYGLSKPDRGRLEIHGRTAKIRKPQDALRRGVSLLTEDRKDSGIVGCRPIRENISLSILRRLSRLGFIRSGAANGERRVVGEMFERFHIKAASPELPVQRLSGGNQQKVVLSRCVTTDPKILLCDEPTRGIDEGTKQQIYSFLADFVKGERHGAIVVSSELDEILQVSDRILVFRRGKIAGEIRGSEATPAKLTHLAS
jgi:ABC-type sugar transport system ATPase subunit